MFSKSGFGRVAVYAAVIAATAFAALPRGSAAAPVGQGGSRTFPETHQTVSGRFLDVWTSVGKTDQDRIYINGFPLTDRHSEISLTDGKPYDVQWFERARFEAHPELAKPYDVELGLLGVFSAEGRKDTPFQKVANPGGGVQWFPETQHSLGDSSTGGKAIAQFWGQYGGLAQFGFPLSQPFMETSKQDGKQYLVQYFERQRFEYHPENAGSRYLVELGLLGAEQKGQVPVVEATLSGRDNPVSVLNVGRGPQDPSNLMPYSDSTLVGLNFLNAVFNGMTKRDANNQVQPDLAYYVPTFDNGGAYYVGSGGDKHLVVKYKMKRGVKWFDGQEVTSADWIFTYKLVLNPDFPASSRQSFEKFSSVDNPDKYTVIVNFLSANEAANLIKRDASTYSFLQYYVTNNLPVVDPIYNELLAVVLPAHFLSTMNAADIVGSDYSRTPWGTGPYHVTKFETGQTIDMAINPNYNVTPNKPVIAQIHSPFYSDAKQLSVNIDLGNLQLTTSESLTPDLLPQLQAVANKGKAVLINHAGFSYEHLDFNNQKAPFNDIRLRQAVRYGLDMDAINRSIFGGGLTLINTWLPGTNWASAENPANQAAYGSIISQLPKYTYDVAKANSLLDQAGWVKGSDGIRVKNGHRLTLDWHTTTKTYRKLVATAAQQYMLAIGIEQTPDPKPSGQTFGAPPDGPLYSGSYGDYGLIEFAWQFLTDEPGGDGLFDTSQIPSAANSNSGSNDLFWSNADNDKLLQQADSAPGHTPDRIKAYLQQQVIFMQQLPSAPLFALPTLFLANANLKNLSAPAGGDLRDWQNYYLSK